MPANASPTALANRLAKLQQVVSQRDHTGLNPDADLGDLDPAWVAEEIAHCRADPVYFVDTYCKIQSDKGHGLIPFDLYPYQRDVLARFEAHRECIVLKARQLGISELAAAYAVWYVTFRPRINVVVLSQGENEAKEFTGKARTAWGTLPDWLRVPDKDPNKTSTLELTNGSRILPKPATAKAARGLNAQLLIIDEMAHQDDQAEIFTAVSPIARSAGNKIICISTANGSGNFYHEAWVAAEEGDGMHPIFLSWNVRPERDEAWLIGATKNYTPWMRAQEYPATPAEAFILSGRPRFDMDAITALLPNCSEPLGTELNGALRVWQFPIQNRRYVIGADTAEGLGKGDYSAAIVLDWQTGEDVAELHGHINPQEFAGHLAAVGHFYNDALIGVERNGHGGTVLLELSAHLGYPALYAHRDFDATGAASERLGWPTSTRTKPVAIDGLAQVLAERGPIHNAALLAECRTYVVRDNGTTGADGSLHDDRVMAMAIAVQLRNYQPQQQIVTSLHDELATIEPDDWRQIERQWHREVAGMHNDWGSMGGLPTVDSRY